MGGFVDVLRKLLGWKSTAPKLFELAASQSCVDGAAVAQSYLDGATVIESYLDGAVAAQSEPN